MTASSAARLAKTAVTGRNGLPLSKPYVYNGDGTSMPEAEVRARLAAVRVRLSAPPAVENAPLSAPPEWHREQRDEAPAPSLATSREARAAALNPPQIIQGEVIRDVPALAAPAPEPIDWSQVYVHRRAFYVRPPGLDARLAQLRKPAPPPRAPRRCRRCGYLKTRCACGGGR